MLNVQTIEIKRIWRSFFAYLVAITIVSVTCKYSYVSLQSGKMIRFISMSNEPGKIIC